LKRVAGLVSVAIGVAMLMGTAMPASYADTVFTCNNSGSVVSVAMLMGTAMPASYADTVIFTCNNSGSSPTNTVVCTGNDLGNNVAM